MTTASRWSPTVRSLSWRLPHTPAIERQRILGALDSLEATGSTNVEAGLDLAYRVASESFQQRALNRVILCSDGVATRGERGAGEVLDKVKIYAQRGIYLSTIGFGQQRYNDAFMEQLSGEGNGNYAFVDSLDEANVIFRQNLPATLQVLAQDAKIQVDFDPSVVRYYRLLGYENRDIADKDFRNDKIDAGEVGPGSTVTALYEIVRAPNATQDLGKVHVRFRHAATLRIEELDFPLPQGVLATQLGDTTDRFRVVAAAAEFAELLRKSYWATNGSYLQVQRLLGSLHPSHTTAPVRELIELVQIALKNSSFPRRYLSHDSTSSSPLRTRVRHSSPRLRP